MEFILAGGKIVVRDNGPLEVTLEVKNPKGERVSMVAVTKLELKRLANALKE